MNQKITKVVYASPIKWAQEIIVHATGQQGRVIGHAANVDTNEDSYVVELHGGCVRVMRANEIAPYDPEQAYLTKDGAIRVLVTDFTDENGAEFFIYKLQQRLVGTWVTLLKSDCSFRSKRACLQEAHTTAALAHCRVFEFIENRIQEAPQ